MKSWLAGNRVPPIHDVKAGAPGGLRFMCRKESLGLRHPLKSAIAVVLAVAMLVPTASAAPSVVLPNGTDGNAPTIAAADLVGNAEPEGIVDGSTIIISNYRQLTAIGTGVPVTDGDAAEDTFGTGRTISDEAGSPLTYALDATYRLAGTISMPQNGVWQLPAGFAGTFETPAIVADPGLYDQSTDTLYVHNVYQLAMLAQSDAADQPVMSNDAEPSTFGMGQPVMKADGRMLTYGGAANVALAMDFTTATPQGEAGQITLNDAADGSQAGTDSDATPADATVSPQDGGEGNADSADTEGLDGRDYVGQVTKEINDVTYILIGNEQQLRAIGSGKKVNNPVIQGTQTCISSSKFDATWTDDPSTFSAIYAGDADLPAGAKLRNGDAPSDHDDDLSLCLTEWDSGKTRTKRYTLDSSGGFADVDGVDTGLSYTADADYIIFRDIDVSKNAENPDNAQWDPLMFSGAMFGAKSASPGTAASLWNQFNQGSVGFGLEETAETAARPEISNVHVIQTGEMDTDKQSGIGFFASLYSRSSFTETTLGDSVGTARVSGLILADITVDNQSTKTQSVDSLVDAVSQILGGLLGFAGGILGQLLGWVIPGLGDLKLGDALRSLFDLHNADDSVFATGAFAGRIVGDVHVSRCEVRNIAVSNNKAMTGGFVGYIEGQTRYSLVDGISGDVIKFLTEVLNVIPGLGLDDLITLLLNNKIIDIDNLIPVGYYSPVVSNSVVSGFQQGSESVGAVTSDYAGGFVGVVIGGIIEHSTIQSSAVGYQVLANNYAGGFAGLARDAEMEGLLQNLGIQLINVNIPASIINDSRIIAQSIEIIAGNEGDPETTGNRAGGFVGALAASYVVNSSISVERQSSVTATGNYAGGVTGQATLSWITNLGMETNGNNEDLLGAVSRLVAKLVTGGGDNSGQLLTLMGFSPSAILGTALNGPMSVTAKKSYAGGFLGEGEGTVVAASDAQHLGDLVFWQEDGRYAGSAETAQPKNNAIKGLTSVSAGDSYAGGIAGNMETASIGGVLNKTFGIGDLNLTKLGDEAFNTFEVSNVSVNADSGALSVTAVNGYSVGGGLGSASGGFVEDVDVHGLQSVSGLGEVGGFIGQAAPGSVISGEGIDLLGLVKLSGLLSVANSTKLTVDGVIVEGVHDGFTVTAKGGQSPSITETTAGGFYGRANSTATSDAHVIRLKSVTAPKTNGDAGGFVGLSATGGLASIADDEQGSSILEGLLRGDGLLSVDQLLGAVPYMVPTYKYTDVTYVDVSSDTANVTADVAGGFAGSFESGEVNILDSADEADKVLQASVNASPWAVRNINSVVGQSRAGGFAGTLESGSLADAGGGLSLLGGGLKIEVTELLSVLNAYIPSINQAGVSSVAKPGADGADDGFIVSAAGESGAAGGFVGYASGAQISYSDVSTLRRSKQVDTTSADPDGDPDAPVDLSKEENAAPPIASNTISYAVIGGRYAGGYVGHLNIGSSASIGDGLNVLDGVLELGGLVDALQVVVSTIEHSDVNGQAGGFAVLASSGADGGNPIGMAGGFAGLIAGGHIQDSNAYNFITIVGQETAGGYAGQIEPGNVANVIGKDAGILGSLLDVGANFLTVGQDFVPSIRNSETTAVPCGGEVIAMAYSDGKYQRGMAGGYVGHNVGGQIWGKNTESWKKQVVTTEGEDTSILPQPYDGPTREAAAIRIRTVWGAEYAGGFTGLMEAGDTAQTGGLSLLWGLVTVDNLLDALSVAYATEENTAVYGPLAKLDVDTWNSWVEFVGQYGGYGSQLANDAGKVEDKDQLHDMLAKYTYGFDVTAGRGNIRDAHSIFPGGDAGGYVGMMKSGTITNGQTHDVKTVSAMRAAGGFVGEAATGGVAELGGVSLVGVDVDLGDLLPNVAQVFVPTIKNSSVTGWRSGMTITSEGTGKQEDDIKNITGNAGGYIGYGSGVQIWGDADTADNTGCNAFGLRRVSATAYAGGFAGKLVGGSVASVDTNASDGFFQKLLDTVIGGAGITNLVDVLEASMSTVRNAHVSATATDESGSVTAGDAQWGFTIDAYQSGDANPVYAIAAGGFAGAIEATVLGELTTANDPEGVGGDGTNLPVNPSKGVSVSGLRGVDGGNYAGGLVGFADVAGAADVADGNTASAGATVLDLIGIGGISVLQTFQPCIYAANVTGVDDGITVRAHTADTSKGLAEYRSGNAGGFVGTIMSGTIRESRLAGLNAVTGPSYTGGFVGYTGTSGVVDADSVSLADELLGVSASVADTFSTLVQRSTVTGIAAGYTVTSAGASEADEDAYQIAGGFAGNADLAHIRDCEAKNLKRVGSGEIAGGFAGKGTHGYLASVGADSPLVQALLIIVSELVGILWIPGALDENTIIDVNLTDWVLHLQVGGEDNVLTVSLLGIPIEVSLNKETDDDTKAVAYVKIGSSTIELNVSKDEDGNVTIEDSYDVVAAKISLIKANMTVIEESTVTGIADGYDVFAGGSSQIGDAADADSGFAGGFMGHSDEAQLKNNEMLYCDVVKGAADKVAPFIGRTDYVPAHSADTVDKQITGNTYHVYRGTELAGQVLSGTITTKLEDDAPTPITGVLDDGDPLNADAPADPGNAKWTRFDIHGHKPVQGKSNHEDWRGAYVQVDGQEKLLNVYMKDGAKAVLMADTEVSDNGGGITPEPEEGQDPCEQSIDLTVSKAWKDDYNRQGGRPSAIQIRLVRSYTDADGHTVSEQIDENGNVVIDPEYADTSLIELSAADSSTWSDTWQRIIHNLPVAFEDPDASGNEPFVRYYTYSVEEVNLIGGSIDLGRYTTTILPDENGEFAIVITNELPLPSTGGSGVTWILAMGMLLIGAGLYWQWRSVRGTSQGGGRRGRHRATA